VGITDEQVLYYNRVIELHSCSQGISQSIRSSRDWLEKSDSWPCLRFWWGRAAKKMYDCSQLQQPVEREEQGQDKDRFINETSMRVLHCCSLIRNLQRSLAGEKEHSGSVV
jgi:hypothetical protein